MNTCIIMDFPGVTQKQYDRAMEHLGLEVGTGAGDWPKGLISHAAGPVKHGWRVVDVWESRADFDQFFQERLSVAVHAAGIEGDPKNLQFFDLYNLYVAP